MRYLHTMLRVRNLDTALEFFVGALGLKEVRRIDNDKGKFTLLFLCAPEDEELVKQSKGRPAPTIELTHNWDEESYGEDRFFGHLAFEVDDIYATCERLMKLGITINRPPRDGQMAFVRSPDLQSVELLQRAKPCRRRSHGPRCRTPAIGKAHTPAICCVVLKSLAQAPH